MKRGIVHSQGKTFILCCSMRVYWVVI